MNICRNKSKDEVYRVKYKSKRVDMFNFFCIERFIKNGTEAKKNICKKRINNPHHDEAIISKESTVLCIVAFYI